MLRMAAKATTEVIAPVVMYTQHTKGYAQYHVIDEPNSLQDDSKVEHPGVTKKECDNENCQTQNCADKPTLCDQETTTNSLIGHVTHNKDLGDVVVENSVNTNRGQSFVKVYEEKQPIPENEVYNGYNYHLSKAIQQEQTTQQLNELTKDLQVMKEEDNHNDDEK